MTAHDQPTFAFVTADGAPTLPDPAARPVGELHDLSNASVAAVAWAATGTNPFLVDGVAVATLSVAAGATARVVNNGTKWALVRAPFGRRIVAATGVTDASGNVTFTFTPPFATTPVISHSLQTASTSTTEARVTAVSPSSVTFNARGSAIVVLLGINILGAPVPLAGATVHMHAMEAG